MAVVVMQLKCADVPGFLLEMSTACSQLSPGFCWGDWKPPLIPHPRETKPCCRRQRPMSCRARSSRRPAESRRWPQRPASPRPLPGLSTYPGESLYPVCPHLPLVVKSVVIAYGHSDGDPSNVHGKVHAHHFGFNVQVLSRSPWIATFPGALHSGSRTPPPLHPVLAPEVLQLPDPIFHPSSVCRASPLLGLAYNTGAVRGRS